MGEKTTSRGKRKRKQQKKQLEYAAERTTMISMENGLRTLNIARLAPGWMRETTMQKEIVKGMDKNKIQIAAIQETRITQDKSNMMENYRIITSASTKSETAGIFAGRAAIAIRESLQHHITQITRQGSRELRVTLDHAE